MDLTFLSFLTLVLIAGLRLALPALGYSQIKGRFLPSIWLLLVAGGVSLAGSARAQMVAHIGYENIAQMKNPTPGDVAALQQASQYMLFISGLVSGLIFLVAMVLLILDLSKLSRSQAFADGGEFAEPEELESQ